MELDDELRAVRPDFDGPTPETVEKHRQALIGTMKTETSAELDAPEQPTPQQTIQLTNDTAMSARRYRNVAIAAAAIAAVGLAGVFFVNRSDDSSVATGEQTPASNVENEAAARQAPQDLVCEGEAPEPELPAHFAGPILGPAPESLLAVDEGQLVQHWVSDTGTIEMRWPANGSYSTENPEVPNTRTPEDGDQDAQSNLAIVGFQPVLGAEPGRCEEMTLAGFGTESIFDAFSTAVASLPREDLDAPAVVSERLVAAPPLVVECTGADEFTPPTHVGRFEDTTIYNTPEDALETLIAKPQPNAPDDDTRLNPSTGYDKLTAPDGSVYFAHNWDWHANPNVTEDPGPDAEAIFLFKVVAVAGGWQLDDYEISGC